jgi:predicted GNAT family N-acyltransferase
MDAEPLIRRTRSHQEFLAALAVRRAVFVDEQGGPLDEEPDAWDWSARHYVVELEGEVVGTARLYQPAFGTGKIGRVALLPAYRRRGWGERLLRAVLRDAAGLGLREVVLDAQTGAAAWYARFGFVPEGAEFLDAGILHRKMRLTLVSGARCPGTRGATKE